MSGCGTEHARSPLPFLAYDLEIRKITFEGLSEKDICETIVAEKLGWKQVMGMLPKKLGLTAAIFVAMLDQLSDKDLVILTPTLEEFGLLKHEPIKQRWQEALKKQEDQRARNIAKNIRDKETAKHLEDSADAAVVKAVAEATKEADIRAQAKADALFRAKADFIGERPGDLRINC